MATSLLRLSRHRRALLAISSVRLALSTQPHVPSPSPSPTPSSARRLPHFLSFLAAAAAAAAGGATVALCDSGLDHRVGGKDSADLVVRGERKFVPQEFIDELASFLGDNITLDYEERSFHGTPQNSFHKAVNLPDVVVFPSSQDEVQRIVMACNKHKVPIVPYGGATSIEGHTLAPHGGVCIDMTLMKKIKSLNVEDMDVVVEPGVGWIELNEYLKPYGLFFPLDPGKNLVIVSNSIFTCFDGFKRMPLSFSGNINRAFIIFRRWAWGHHWRNVCYSLFWFISCEVITNLSLYFQVCRYGTMRDNVINLRAVLPNGDVVKTGSRARKSAAGYDLARLIIGSEGTLGVITEVTLRLQKLPSHSVVAMCNFKTIKDAADVAIATMLSGIQVSRVELLDEVQIKAINMANGKNLPEVPTLMFEFIGTEAYALEQTLLVQKIATEHHGSDFVFVEEPDAKAELWKIRKEALWAGFAMKPDHEAMITIVQKDVCVPLSRLAECISTSKRLLDASPLTCLVIAHAGDGNFHTIILFDPSQEDQRKEAERLNHFMVHTALSMEGTCTGEHGVGTGKMKAIPGEGVGHRVTQDDEKNKGGAGSQQHHESGKADPASRLHMTVT
ncbi:D-lactate dehydrogenase [cytochrome] mitochondrial [Zea mays]|uniref:D-lactate dehydrogenase (cytochrome) n=1 Tax=Zea mays TaxID=4577 RepID=A0A1D6F9W7_MAIZE|nr:D-lactate dehydrogenase [cytochrome] mitochondrial [Zea mays]